MRGKLAKSIRRSVRVLEVLQERSEAGRKKKAAKGMALVKEKLKKLFGRQAKPTPDRKYDAARSVRRGYTRHPKTRSAVRQWARGADMNRRKKIHG